MSKIPLLIGTLGAGVLAFAFSSNAKATQRGSSSSSGPTAPSGVSLDDLAAKSTSDMLKQDIAAVRDDVTAWKQASDPETAGALSFTIEQAASGATLPESVLDGSAGSPVLRAFGMRVLQLEGRAPRLKLWANAWKSILPILAAALTTKADGVTESAAASGDTHAGSEADPVPDAATMNKIMAAVTSQDTAQMRAVATQLDSLGFPEAAADLRKMADMIDAGVAHANPALPSPVPVFVPPPPISAAPLPDALPAPTTPSVSSSSSTPAAATSRVAIVHKGEGISQVASRVLGSTTLGNSRWKEMRTINVPPFKQDKNGNVLLNPGDALNVPPSWPASTETLPGVSHGPGVQPVIDTSGTTTSAPATTTAPAALPAAAQNRLIVVKKGEGVAQVAMRARGKSYTDADRKRMRDFNVPPFKKTADGSGLVLNPGDKLRIPPEWPVGVDEVLGGSRGRPMNPRQLRASRIALAQKFGHDDADALRAWQKSERIEATGDYGPASAIVLCKVYGFVPPVPKVWGQRERQNRQAFARVMYGYAKRDPQRSDEYRRVARQAEGKVQ